MTRHNAPTGKSIPRPKRKLGKKTPARSHAPERIDCDISRNAFRKTLDQAAVSIRSSGPMMFTDKTVAQRIASNGFAVPPLRSARLAIPFALNLLGECFRVYGGRR